MIVYFSDSEHETTDDVSDRMDVDVDAQTVARCPRAVVVTPTRPGARVSFAPTVETQFYSSTLGPNPCCRHRMPLSLDKPIGKPYHTNIENSQERGVNNRQPRRLNEFDCFERLLAYHDNDTIQKRSHAIFAEKKKLEAEKKELEAERKQLRAEKKQLVKFAVPAC